MKLFEYRPVVKKDISFKPFVQRCGTVCARGCYEEQICKIILNLGQWAIGSGGDVI